MLAPTPAELERLVRALEQQMDGLHFDKPPESLAAALEPLLKAKHPSAALIRLALRLGLEAAYPIAAARAADGRLAATERATFIRTLGELKRPESLPSLFKLLAGTEPEPVGAAA